MKQFSNAHLFLFFAALFVAGSFFLSHPARAQHFFGTNPAYVHIRVVDGIGNDISNASIAFTIQPVTSPRFCAYAGQDAHVAGIWGGAGVGYWFSPDSVSELQICCNAGYDNVVVGDGLGTTSDSDYLEEWDAMTVSISAPGFQSWSGRLVDLWPNSLATNGATTTYQLTMNPTLGNILGRFFVDSNANGVADAGEAIIKPSTNPCGGFVLDGVGVNYSGTVSGTTGAYWCNPDPYYQTGLIPSGNYTLTAFAPSGWSFTTANPISFSLADGGNEHHWFGLHQNIVTLSGRVINDGTGGGIGGVVINQNQTNPPGCNIGTATTDASGYFSFSGIAAGKTFCMRVPAIGGFTGPDRSYECQVAGTFADPDGCNLHPSNDMSVDNAYNFHYKPPPVPTVTCSGNPSTVSVFQGVTWTATPSGGNGTYTYSWSGTDGLSGTSQSVTKSYTSGGAKVANITVTSGGATGSNSCQITVRPPLLALCAVSPNPAGLGQQVTWSSSATGGTGSYSYSWSGTDLLSGNTSSVTKTYLTSGTKQGTVTITSGAETDSRTCQLTVNPLLSASCSGQPNPASTGSGVAWTASASGGTGSYTYSWSGTDGLSGNSSVATKTYSTDGTKQATVIVTSGTQTKSTTCQINVVTPPLSVSCFAQPNPVNVGKPATWSSSATGGTGSYTYSWSGTDGLAGTTAAVVKTYSSGGLKNGTVTVTSGTQTESANCSLFVSSAPIVDATAAKVSTGPYVKQIFAAPGQTIYFFGSKDGNGDGKGTYDPDGDRIIEYKWDFNGTDPINGAEYVSSTTGDTTYVYSQVGVYNARLLAVDSENISSFDDVQVNISTKLTATCTASPNPQNVQQGVLWRAFPSGGTGGYNFRWGFDDNADGKIDLFIAGNPVSRTYLETGTKNATVTVRSGSEVATAACSVSIGGQCSSNCSVQGSRRCTSSTQYQTCVLTKDGCLIWSPEPSSSCSPSTPLCSVGNGQCTK